MPAFGSAPISLRAILRLSGLAGLDGDLLRIGGEAAACRSHLVFAGIEIDRLILAAGSVHHEGDALLGVVEIDMRRRERLRCGHAAGDGAGSRDRGVRGQRRPNRQTEAKHRRDSKKDLTDHGISSSSC